MIYSKNSTGKGVVMRNLILGSVLALMAVNANAKTWDYKYGHDDFDGDTRLATLKSDNDEYKIMIGEDAKSESKVSIFIPLPLGKITSSECNPLCDMRIIADGNKDIEPIKLFAMKNHKMYFLYGDGDKRLSEIFENNKVVKMKLPLYNIGADVLTFTQTEKFNKQKLLSLK